PFVYERLVMGHWGLLVAYATLPFVARAASDLRTGTPGSVRRLGLTLAIAAAASPPGGLIAAAVALCVAAAPPWSANARGAVGRVVVLLGVALVVNAPWLVPSVLRPGGVPVRAEGAAAFASRPDGPLGAVGGPAGLGVALTAC